jgi:hypothetical protein
MMPTGVEGADRSLERDPDAGEFTCQGPHLPTFGTSDMPFLCISWHSTAGPSAAVSKLDPPAVFWDPAVASQT